MREYIPTLLKGEIDQIKDEIKGQNLVVIFDGTTTVGEIFGVIFRWVNYDTFTIKQKCVHVGIYKSSFDHEEQVHAVLHVVTIEFGVQPAFIIGWMHDRASVNNAAAEVLLRLYNKSIDTPCMSHTINHCGDNLAGHYSKPVIQDLNSRKIPLEFKILIALRILGRDAVADDCDELSHVGESTCRVIFKTFINNFANLFYGEYVKWPEDNDLINSMEVYRRLGFPGCFGSIDCTHVKWSMCSKDLKWKATGKEGFSSLTFEAVVTHDRRCIHVSISFLGSYNDITISRNDDFVQHLVEGKMKDVEYVLYDEEGILRLCKGAYLLSDNGYLKQSILMCPWKTPSTSPILLGSEWAESVRKDVECFFGVLKARFWYLRNGIRCHDAETIQNAFKTAALFHNMLLLLVYDGREINCNESGEDSWTNLDPNTEDVDAIHEEVATVSDEELEMLYLPTVESTVIDMFQLPETAHRFMPGKHFTPSGDFNLLRESFVTHFSHFS